jgi:zinc protease
VIVETDASLPIIHFNVNLVGGSVTDPATAPGMTRLAMRLMRRTTLGLHADDVDDRIDRLGASLGIEVSATATGFAGSVITRSFEPVLELLQGALDKPGLHAEEFDRLKRETLAELAELKDNDRALARYWFKKRMFEGHPFGRSVAGTSQSVKAITLPALREHIRNMLVRERLVLGFAGDIERDRAERAGAQLTEAVPSGPSTDLTPPEPTERRGKRLTIVDKPERTQTQILIGGLGTHPHDPDHTALLVANTVFGGTFTARLSQEVRAKRGWSYGAYSSLPGDRVRHAFSMWTFPKAEDAAPCIELELGLLNDWVDRGISAEELGWAKQYLVRSHAFAVDTCSKRAALDIEEELYGLPKNYFREYTSRVEAVTLAAANAAIQKRISKENLEIVVVGTASLISDAVQSAVGDVVDFEVVPFDVE